MDTLEANVNATETARLNIINSINKIEVLEKLNNNTPLTEIGTNIKQAQTYGNIYTAAALGPAFFNKTCTVDLKIAKGKYYVYVAGAGGEGFARSKQHNTVSYLSGTGYGGGVVFGILDIFKNGTKVKLIAGGARVRSQFSEAGIMSISGALSPPGISLESSNAGMDSELYIEDTLACIATGGGPYEGTPGKGKVQNTEVDGVYSISNYTEFTGSSIQTGYFWSDWSRKRRPTAPYSTSFTFGSHGVGSAYYDWSLRQNRYKVDIPGGGGIMLIPIQ